MKAKNVVGTKTGRSSEKQWRPNGVHTQYNTELFEASMERRATSLQH